jgi:acetoin utilization deacetylase AcuC-like enzyme
MDRTETDCLVDVFWHDDVLAHDTGAGVFEVPPSPLLEIQMPHPEGPNRIRNMKHALEHGPNATRFAWHEGRHATDEELRRFHTPEYVNELRAGARTGKRFTATTLLSAGSWPALTASAGTAIAATRHVLAGSGRPAFALVRPPGHHAAPSVADGYCFFNNVALAAEESLAQGLERVAIVDWDVHHGNGTQEGFYDRANVLTVSLHMDHGAWGPTHPQTGSIGERGRGQGVGYNVNVPLPMGAGDHAYLLAFDRIVKPRVEAFRPDLLLVAHGVDAGQFDPNGRQLVTARGFYALASRARALADRVCNGRLVIVQEGGYNPAHSAFCTYAAVEGFAGLPQSTADPLAYLPESERRAQAEIAALVAAIEEEERRP